MDFKGIRHSSEQRTIFTYPSCHDILTQHKAEVLLEPRHFSYGMTQKFWLITCQGANNNRATFAQNFIGPQPGWQKAAPGSFQTRLVLSSGASVLVLVTPSLAPKQGMAGKSFPPNQIPERILQPI
ncbi:hypothetical protein V2G26_011418 [Clonostachys chloroleuca]